MKITTKLVLDMRTGRTIEHEWFEYPDDAPLALAGGGPSQQQKDAAASQAAENAQNTKTQADMLAMYKDQYNKIAPFETGIMQNGLPYMKALTDYGNGTTARAALPARAALIRSMGGNSSVMPNGFKTAEIGDFNNNLARSFDDNMTNGSNADYTARQNAASLLTNQQQLANPLGWAGTVTQGNNAIMQAPLATPSPWATIAGAGMGALGSYMGSSNFGKF